MPRSHLGAWLFQDRKMGFPHRSLERRNVTMMASCGMVSFGDIHDQAELMSKDVNHSLMSCVMFCLDVCVSVASVTSVAILTGVKRLHLKEQPH